MGEDFYTIDAVQGCTHRSNYTERELVERQRARRAIALHCGDTDPAAARELLEMVGLVDEQGTPT